MNRQSNIRAILSAGLMLAGSATLTGDTGSAHGMVPAHGIALQVTSVEDGFAQEEAWVKQHRPDLVYRDIHMEIITDRAYDVLSATDRGGRMVELYFDTILSTTQPAMPPTAPIPVTQSAPVYPIDLKFQGITGYAIVRFIVEKDGSVSGVSVVRQKLPQFGKAAIETVKKWTYEPATKFGQAVRMSSQVTLYFTLAPKK